MTILRKACRSCTVSKRKCVVQLPKCARCAQRGLECLYDLEPLNTPTQSDRLPKLSWNPSNCDPTGYCIMKTLKFRPSSIDPAICSPGHADSLEFIRLGYQPLPALVREGKPGAFVHPKLQLENTYNHFAIFTETGEDGTNSKNLKRLLQLDIKSVPIAEALTALQALLVYLSTFLFSPDHPNPDYLLTILSQWTATLFSSAQTNPPRTQSLWQQWLLAESIRRTILMSYILSLAFSGFKYGYCSNWLFVESLPFDGRTGLWVAQSPQAWIAAARARTGEEVGQELSSLHEFAEGSDGADPDFGGDVFLSFLVYGHNGFVRTYGYGGGGCGG